MRQPTVGAGAMREPEVTIASLPDSSLP